MKMSAKLEIVGMLAEPTQAVTSSGKNVLNVSVAHTPRRFNKDSNQWEDSGDTLWVRAAFWEDEADLLAPQIRKGMRVRLEGEPELSVREHNGRTHTNLELKRASISFLPRRQAQADAGGAQNSFAGGSSGQAGYGGQGDGWANPGQAFGNEESPF